MSATKIKYIKIEKYTKLDILTHFTNIYKNLQFEWQMGIRLPFWQVFSIFDNWFDQKIANGPLSGQVYAINFLQLFHDPTQKWVTKNAFSHKIIG